MVAVLQGVRETMAAQSAIYLRFLFLDVYLLERQSVREREMGRQSLLVHSVWTAEAGLGRSQECSS